MIPIRKVQNMANSFSRQSFASTDHKSGSLLCSDHLNRRLAYARLARSRRGGRLNARHCCCECSEGSSLRLLTLCLLLLELLGARESGLLRVEPQHLVVVLRRHVHVAQRQAELRE